MSIQLASLFRDSAVLQRDQVIPVWGNATPNQRIEVRLAEHVAITRSNADGYFRVDFPAMSAGGPYTMEVSIPECAECQLISNILIGEVWIASGQSNMQWELGSCGSFAGDLAEANYPQLRLFTVPVSMHIGKRFSFPGEWKSATPDTVADFSAVAISFARRIHESLQVPVGIISSSCGGTFIEAWISEQGLARIPELDTWIQNYRVGRSSPNFWQDLELLKGLNKPVFGADPGNTGEQQGWHLPTADLQDWKSINLPAPWQAYSLPDCAIVWFRRKVKIPAHWKGIPLVLSLGAIDKQDITYVNGVEVARTGKDFETQYWDQQRVYPIPGHIIQSDEIDIAVRVYSHFGFGGLTGPRTKMFIRPFGKPDDAVMLSGDWLYKMEHKLKDAIFPSVSLALLGHQQHNSPNLLFDNMIYPLIPYAVRGVIWYQGENNTSRNNFPYRGLTRAWVEDWRHWWGNRKMPFITTQLTNYNTPQSYQHDSKWARLREQQLLAANEIPGVGMAVTIDLGEANDIHPKNKVPIGERLAQYALHHEYGFHDVIPGSPTPVEFAVDGSSILCRFNNAPNGLISKDGLPIRHFVVAGEDGQFVPAEAVIQGDCVKVHSQSIPAPRYVRYAWADNPEGVNLYSKEGLPVTPFRSDSFE
jgi:sialate O-acetylesterase